MFSAKSPIESKIVRMFWNDGLLDILAGLGVLLVGISWHFDLTVMGAVAPVLLVPLWKPLRQKITEPNLGLVEFSDRQQVRNRSFLIIAIGSGTVTFLLGIGVYLMVSKQAINFDMKRIVQALPAVLLGGMALMTAQITSLKRFHGYAAVLIGLGIITAILMPGPAWALIAGGTVMLVSGGIVLQQFLQHVRSRTNVGVESKSDV